MYRAGIFTCPNSGLLRINVSRQVKPRTLSQMTDQQREAHLAGNRLAGGPLLRVAGALQTHTRDTFLFISHTTNVLLFKFRCNVFTGVGIIKEMPDSVASGTHCITETECLLRGTEWLFTIHVNIHLLPFTTRDRIRSRASPCELCGLNSTS